MNFGLAVGGYKKGISKNRFLKSTIFQFLFQSIMNKIMSMVGAGVSRVARAVNEIINVFKKPSSHEKKDLKQKKKDLKQKEKDLIKRRTLYPISAQVYPLENYMKDGALKALMGPPTLLPSSTSSSAALASSASFPVPAYSASSSKALESFPALSLSASSPTALEEAVPCLVLSTYVQSSAKRVFQNAKKAAFNMDVVVPWNTFNALFFHPNIQDIVSIPIPLKHLIRTEISITATTFLGPKNQDEAHSATRELNTEASAKGKKFKNNSIENTKFANSSYAPA